nr:MAG TPA: hypothetical protein [Caudoviricetes sp.]
MLPAPILSDKYWKKARPERFVHPYIEKFYSLVLFKDKNKRSIIRLSLS